MQIQRIPFPPIGSNMYVVTQGRDAIVLDPWPDEATMQCLQGYHVLLVLTHEHVDHISGLGRMQRALPARTLWQENCTPWLRNPGNTTPVLLAALSVSRGAAARDFLRTLQLKTETYAPDMTFGDHIALDWGVLHLEGYATPGHSRGSACYRIGPDAFFSGDSLVPGNAVVTRLRGGDAAVLMDAHRAVSAHTAARISRSIPATAAAACRSARGSRPWTGDGARRAVHLLAGAQIVAKRLDTCEETC